MKTHLEFRSNKFPAYDDEDYVINPGQFGKRLAEYFSEKLVENGFEPKDLIPEDWGWVLPVKNDGFSLWVGCGGHQAYDDAEDTEFICFVVAEKPLIMRFFKKIDTAEQMERLARALDKILTSDSDIRDFRWWDEDEV